MQDARLEAPANLRPNGRLRAQAACPACASENSAGCNKLTGVPSKWSVPARCEAARQRHIICHADEPTDQVYAICEGWAFRFHRLQDGRRHILSFLISGDLASGVSPGGSGFSIQAITDVRYCTFDGHQIKAMLQQNPQAFDDWLANNSSEDRQAGRTAVALSRFLAHERVAWLILQLRDRLAARGMINGDAIEFPLRQTHIADATGLTTVHVCRVINMFRKSGVFAIEGGVLKIFDLARLRRIAEVL